MNRSPLLLTAALALLLGLTAACSRPERTEILFEDATLSSGLASYVGMTYGAAWGDFDGDGLPDLYVTNHLNGAKLFRNLGGGRFEDVTKQWFSPQDLGGDKHGAAWADFDNDGRLDLVQLMGAERGVGAEAKRLFVNRGTRFEDIAEAAGVANPLSRTRMPLWVDVDGDGRLDLFHGAEARFDDSRLPFVFLQRNGTFDASPQAAAFGSQSAPFCVLTSLTDGGTPQLVCRVPQKGKTAQVFSTGRLPMPEHGLLPATAFEDIAAGDFDNDGLVDLYLARKNPAPPVSFGRPAANELIADTWIGGKSAGEALRFSFRSAGRLDWRVAPAFPGDAVTAEAIHVGERGAHPPALEFVLPPELKGMPSFEPGARAAVYIGTGGSDEWQVGVTGPGGAPYQQIAIQVRSSEPITDVKALGGGDASEEAPARLFMNRGGRLVEESEKRGLNARLVSAVNAVAGDFDNDMHLDLFVLASGDIGKRENLLLLNRGDGRFDVVAGAGGAAGGTAGVGDSVTTADFDRDGFLDLLVATGGSMGRSMGLPSEAGGYRLYRNLGNGNHWLAIDLEGTKSNRDGIGARVQVTAGGITQVRIQDGGVHHRGQNHARLHFGLAGNTKVDKVEIRWPSGTLQQLEAVEVDRVLRVREP